ncbi:MAG: GNAT family N-acetyltransferase [Clostridia bacterium]|nr:GNAT family N-acetyltransferase [Clostridia bacterium]
MEIRAFHGLPDVAIQLRTTVFVEEQGFEEEFDAVDETAVHLVAFDDHGIPLGTCRVFAQDGSNSYLLGRLCVIKERRGNGVGRMLVQEAEHTVRQLGGVRLRLHSQYRARGFYALLGYTVCSEIEDEQGCPHIWMEKEWNA